MKVLWLGQGGLLFVSGKTKIMIDPYLSDSLSKVNHEFARRMKLNKKLYRVKPDGLIITNNHSDHADITTIERLTKYRKDRKKLTVLSCESVFEQLINIPTVSLANHIMLEEGSEWTIGAFNICAVGAKTDDKSAFGVVITDLETNLKYYVAGDTLYNKYVLESLPKDIYASFIPINGTYGSMNATDAIRFADMIDSRFYVPIHFGMFDKISPRDFDVDNAIIPSIYKIIDFEAIDKQLKPYRKGLDLKFNEKQIKSNKKAEDVAENTPLSAESDVQKNAPAPINNENAGKDNPFIHYIGEKESKDDVLSSGNTDEYESIPFESFSSSSATGDVDIVVATSTLDLERKQTFINDEAEGEDNENDAVSAEELTKDNELFKDEAIDDEELCDDFESDDNEPDTNELDNEGFDIDESASDELEDQLEDSEVEEIENSEVKDDEPMNEDNVTDEEAENEKDYSEERFDFFDDDEEDDDDSEEGILDEWLDDFYEEPESDDVPFESNNWVSDYDINLDGDDKENEESFDDDLDEIIDEDELYEEGEAEPEEYDENTNDFDEDVEGFEDEDFEDEDFENEDFENEVHEKSPKSDSDESDIIDAYIREIEKFERGETADFSKIE